MDLGFGSSNQQVGDATAQAILRSAQAQDAAVTDELRQYDALLSDDAALARLRAQRMQELQQAARDRQRYVQSGHGTYEDLCGGGSSQDRRDVGAAFFAAAKSSERLVVHFYRPSTEYCEVFHKHLEVLCRKHLETRFVKLNVQDADVSDRGASFLVERLGIQVMPTLLLVHNRQAVHQIRGFDEIVGRADCSANALAYVLGVHNVLEATEDEVPESGGKSSASRSRHGINSMRVHKRYGRGSYEDEDIDEY